MVQEKVAVMKRCRIHKIDDVRIVHAARAEIEIEDWRRLVKEKRDEDFMRKLEELLRKLGFTERCP